MRATGHGIISRALVSGRVLYGERVRHALLRHLEKDLGPLALPRVPPSPQPFTVAEYFPIPGITPFHDPRQHAVSLAFVVPVEGDCEPQQDALELTWVSPNEARDPRLLSEMQGGQGVLRVLAATPADVSSGPCSSRRWPTWASDPADRHAGLVLR